MASILIADDESAVRTLMATVLQVAGHSVLTAANGLEAVAVFRSYASAIDLVIMDMVMPVMDGAQAIERIRETRPGVPVICVSGYCDLQIPEGTSLLPKPFGPADLVALVVRLLAQ